MSSQEASAPQIDTALYDRQLRLWGEEGQMRLQQANVCLLGCSATGTELLKNMVLPGVGRFTIVDGRETAPADLGVNFFMTDDALGKPRADVSVHLLCELNDTVSGTPVIQDPGKLIEESDDAALADFFGKFTIVVVADWAVTDGHLLKLGKFLWDNHIPLVVARVTGLVATVRLVCKEHNVVEARVDNPPDDLRINNPWPELQEYADSIDLTTLSSKDHGHVPYVILLIKAVQQWRAAHDGKLPDTFDEKDAFKASIKEMGDIYTEENFEEALQNSVRAYLPYELRDEIKAVFQNPRCSVDQITAETSDFWILANAAKQYVDAHQALPLPGAIPDMTSDTQGYIKLQKIYAAEAERNFAVYQGMVSDLLTKAGRAGDAIVPASIKLFLQNVNVVRSVAFRALEEEFGATRSAPDDLPIMFMVPDYGNIKVYWALRGCSRFLEEQGHFPGESADQREKEVAELHKILNELAEEWGVTGSLEDGEALKWAEEMWRYGGAELHPIASYVGGIVSQEAIKLVSKQFTPLDNTFVYNGTDSTSMVVRA